MGILDRFDDVLVDVSTKSKRAVATAQIKSGIKDIKAEKARRISTLGEKAYGQYLAGKLENEAMAEDLDVLSDLDEQIRSLENKLDELDKVPAASPMGFPCPECGKAIKPDSIFCAYCGANVPEARKQKEDGTMYCLNCRTALTASMEFCPVCGAKVDAEKQEAKPVDDQRFCLDCGTANKPEAVFCRDCGTKLESVEDAPAPVQEQELAPPLILEPEPAPELVEEQHVEEAKPKPKAKTKPKSVPASEPKPEEPLFCVECGTQNKPTAGFCRECGGILEKD